MKQKISHYKPHTTIAGYTLIELLIVIAIIGVLATVGLGVINPNEQMNRARDSKLEANITSIAQALVSYHASNGKYPSGTTWFTTGIVGDKSIFTQAPDPVGISKVPYPIYCVGGFQIAPSNNDYCYKYDATTDNATIYTELQSNTAKARCTSGQIAWYSWHSGGSRAEQAGVECIVSTSQPQVP